jgi:hypothetical protein
METAYVSQLLGWVNVFISLFIILFAFSFFKKTEPHENRRPWMYLFISVLLFFLIELSGVIPLTSNLNILRNFLKTVFIAVVLYVFVFQYSLLAKLDKIIINRKVLQKIDLPSQTNVQKQPTDTMKITEEKTPSKKTSKTIKK